jgi:hypothetical protein
MSKFCGDQLTLFDLGEIAPPAPLAVYDPAWDDDTVDSQLTQFDNSSPECPSSQGFFLGGQACLVTTTATVESLVGGQVASDTKKSAPQHDKPTHWVEKYWVDRNGNKYWYYRYCWMKGRKIQRRYIGSVNSAIAKNRKSEIESAIADGDTPAEIQNLIRSWKT